MTVRLLPVDRVLALIHREVKRCATKADAARALNTTPQFLADVLSGRRHPGGTMLRALGLKRVAAYERQDDE